jgi:ribosomal-protein-alanine N-acetyltransferase
MLEGECFSDPWTKAMFESEVGSPFTVYFVALAGDEVAGYAGMWKILDEGHITNIAVSPRYRRKGLGSLLLNKLIEIAEENKIKVLMLEVRKSNEAAIGLYVKKGFEQVGLRRNYYADNNEDAVLMNFTIRKE